MNLRISVEYRIQWGVHSHLCPVMNVRIYIEWIGTSCDGVAWIRTVYSL